MSREGQARPSRAVLEAAALWSMRLQGPGCTAEDRRAFEAWLGEHPAHRSAFEEIEAASAIAARLSDDPRLQALDAATDRELAAARRAGRVRWRGAVAASLAVAGLLTSGLLALWQPWSPATRVVALPSYETGVGEQRVITLADESAVTLNTHSRIEVDYTVAERRVRLKRGQAFFEVTPDAARPFIAEAGATQITALGTAFDMRLDEGALEVTLLEGRVGVTPAEPGERAPDAARAPIKLSAGERLTLRAGLAPELSEPDLTAIRAWQKGMLVFDNTPLAEVIAEVNRYSVRKLRLAEDARLNEIRISGGFRAGETANLVGVLTARYPIEVERTSFYKHTLVWRD